MILYLSSLHAFGYIMVYDKTKTSLMSKKPFETAQSQLLHDSLLEYMHKFENHYKFYRTVGIIHEYLTRKKSNAKYETTPDEIKLLIVTSVIAKFGLGDFDITNLALLSELDAQLIIHWNILCSFDMDTIILSGHKQIVDYGYDDNVINKSLGFVGFGLVTCLHDILSYQVKHKKWCYKENCKLEKALGEYLGCTGNMLSIVFETDKNGYNYLNFSFHDIMYERHKLRQIYFYACKYRSKNNFVQMTYSYHDIIKTIKQNCAPSLSQIETNKNIYTILKENEKLRLINALCIYIYVKKLLGGIFIEARPFTKYELVYVLTEKVHDEDISDWVHDAMSWVESGAAITKFIEAYIDYGNRGSLYAEKVHLDLLKMNIMVTETYY